MEKQKTIKKEVTIEGAGLNTGINVKCKFKPASLNSGINFIRTDLPKRPAIKACISNVLELSKSVRHTSIGNDGVEIHTIEHLMASISALSIDNLEIEINGREMPAIDGSALLYFEVLRDAGIVEQDGPRKRFVVKEPIWVQDNNCKLMILPRVADDSLAISYTLDYDHPMIRTQHMSITPTEKFFEKEIAPARTFCLEREVEELKGLGLGKGASYDNTLVVGEDGVIKNKLRFDDEYTRHKISDLMGDLYLLGMPITGQIIGIKSGHVLNIKMLKKIQMHIERGEAGAIKAGSVGPDLSKGELDRETIQKILPHRDPFLFVDRIIEIEPDKRAVGIKNLTMNDDFFRGHFPGKPIMPGVLMVEAMAQVVGVILLAKGERHGKIAYFLSMNNVKFRKTVLPGDQLVMDVEIIKMKLRTGQARGRASVDGNLVCEADMMFYVSKDEG
ncbi:MAG: UDP-3-O-[3-hydroxymyristoyl] N-acetylglucosamine deacetylase [Candidatus Omnitrophica bacterium]|nr:UDP-3-O-[3-hydroxymyristoyl] N-acetylglucosamine deacetylase [Candidatus Omnitrophota bacterium]